MSARINIVTLCTGNVARSVMLSFMLTTLAEASSEDWRVRSAGTHVIEGSAMSSRTRDALLRIEELGPHHYGSHRSHQLASDDVLWADVILASEVMHVNYVRTNFPDAAGRVVQIHQFVQFASLDDTFERQLARVALLEPSDEFDVPDPAGGDRAVYDACATQLWEMAQVFTLLASGESAA